MSRQARITKHIATTDFGVEIGPWCNPLTPRVSGYKCLIVDVFNAEELRRRAKADITLSDEMVERIEDVDLVGSSGQIAELVQQAGLLGSLDYVVSSHNLEHIPNPIRFIQGCEKVLKRGGVLSMAIPDRRGCFDYYRPNSTLAEMLDAYFSERQRPTETQIFEHCSHHARKVIDGRPVLGFPSNTPPSEVIPYETLSEAFQRWSHRIATGIEEYTDAHCWTFTPASFELIFNDLAFLGLCHMRLDEVDAADGEFYVHLTNVAEGEAVISSEIFYERRAQLFRKIIEESSVREYATIDESSIHEHASCVKELTEGAQHQILQLTSELARAEEHVEHLQRALAEMRRSTSWRVTKPLRALRMVMRGN